MSWKERAVNELLAELARHVDLPFEHARMLPLGVYRSEAFLEHEIERLFATEWLCVARTADIPNAGDHTTALIPSPQGNRSIIVVRGDDNGVRAFDNVCVHRGAQLVEPGSKPATCNTARITCPYHAWTYRLDGSLAAAPYMSDSIEADGSAFDPERHGLSTLNVETWEGFVFLSQDPTAEPLKPQLAGLTDVVGRFAMDGYVPVYNAVDIWDTNWKLLVENFMDAYHIFKVHKLSFGATGDDTPFTTMYPGTERWAHHRVMNPSDDDMCHPTNATLTDHWRKTTVLAAVFPGLVIQLQPDWLWFLRITPVTTGQCRISWQVAVAPELLDAQADAAAYIETVMSLVHQVNSEDHPIVEGIRRSADRPQFERGPLSYLESNVYDFDSYIAKRLA